jgi:hypothetical protein
MSEPKKKEEDLVNTKIQQKFDLIFANSEEEAQKHAKSEKPDSTVLQMNSNLEDIDDFELENNSTSIKAVKNLTASDKSSPKLNLTPDDTGLIFSLDFGEEDTVLESIPSKGLDLIASANEKSFEEFGETSGFHFDSALEDAINESNAKLSEGTQKTIVINRNDLSKLTTELGSSASLQSSVNTMTNEEAKANIDSTIKDIISPKNLQNTEVLDFESFKGDPEFSSFTIDAENNTSNTMKTPSIAFNINSNTTSKSTTGEFDISSVEFGAIAAAGVTGVSALAINQSSQHSPLEDDLNSFDIDTEEKTRIDVRPSSFSQNQGVVESFSLDSDPFQDSPPAPPLKTSFANTFVSKNSDKENNRIDSSSDMNQLARQSRAQTSYVSDEESGRVQATIRQLREEREDLLSQIKILNGENKEAKQDNLTLRAALDESKIEVSILRKRHMLEMEDIKYRLSLSEEKKSMAEERARLTLATKEKLEQRIRIDYSQVKQREKELESKLEMLSIDVGSQVQSRDQKILELRRKIDSLEFNMENVSIREHKSLDDKRKLEDKLNKIMKTLRHSIKNLEDDIDHVGDESQNETDSTGHEKGSHLKHRTGKA